jgi:hypothetical protein
VSVYPTLGDRVRVASRVAEQAFCGDKRASVRVGCIRQDPSIAATIRVESCSASIRHSQHHGRKTTTALILRSILQQNRRASFCWTPQQYAPAGGWGGSSTSAMQRPTGSSPSRSWSR